SSEISACRVGTGTMLSWLRHIVGFGTRRPGYRQGLEVERWLENMFGELGLEEVRLEPVPVNCWEPSVTSLTLADSVSEIPCFPIPYTAWTASAGLQAPMAFLGDGSGEDFQRGDVRGRI